MTRIERTLLSVTALAGMLMLLATCTERAEAHDAVSGWSYPFACCSSADCREVNTPASAVRVTERGGGWQVNTTGEWISDADTKRRPSPDGQFHWCSTGGSDMGKTICLFVPPSLF